MASATLSCPFGMPSSLSLPPSPSWSAFLLGLACLASLCFCLSLCVGGGWWGLPAFLGCVPPCCVFSVFLCWLWAVGGGLGHSPLPPGLSSSLSLRPILLACLPLWPCVSCFVLLSFFLCWWWVGGPSCHLGCVPTCCVCSVFLCWWCAVVGGFGHSPLPLGMPSTLSLQKDRTHAAWRHTAQKGRKTPPPTTNTKRKTEAQNKRGKAKAEDRPRGGGRHRQRGRHT